MRARSPADVRIAVPSEHQLPRGGNDLGGRSRAASEPEQDIELATPELLLLEGMISGVEAELLPRGSTTSSDGHLHRFRRRGILHNAEEEQLGAKQNFARLEALAHSTGSSIRTVGSTASAVGSHAEADWKKDVGQRGRLMLPTKRHLAQCGRRAASVRRSTSLDWKHRFTRPEAALTRPEAVLTRSEAVIRTFGSTASVAGSHVEADCKKDVGQWEGLTLLAQAILRPSGTSERDEYHWRATEASKQRRREWDRCHLRVVVSGSRVRERRAARRPARGV
jgi:hypothetical protein